MILTELNYKTIDQFTEPNIKKQIQYLISDRYTPTNSTYYAKIMQQTIIYETEDGSEFENSISLTAIFLIDDETDGMIDCFSIVSYPFELRTKTDFETLSNLFEIYQSDLTEVMNNEKQNYQNCA